MGGADPRRVFPALETEPAFSDQNGSRRSWRHPLSNKTTAENRPQVKRTPELQPLQAADGLEDLADGEHSVTQRLPTSVVPVYKTLQHKYSNTDTKSTPTGKSGANRCPATGAKEVAAEAACCSAALDTGNQHEPLASESSVPTSPSVGGADGGGWRPVQIHIISLSAMDRPLA